jgi:transcription elongation factor Elf1
MQEHHFTCPYCWETISVVLDLSEEHQAYIEDCEVCCHPISIDVRAEAGTLTAFTAERAQ